MLPNEFFEVTGLFFPPRNVLSEIFLGVLESCPVPLESAPMCYHFGSPRVFR